MSEAKAGPIEKVAWIAAALSLSAAVIFVLGALLAEANALTVLAATTTGISGGVWAGRAIEAKAVRTGRNMLRL